MSNINGIDVSHWQGNIHFENVKASGIDFVIIKAGGSDKGLYTDSKWEENYKNAKAAGLFVGAYYFAGKNFRGAENGLADAKRFIEQLKGKELEYPVFIDIEAQENRYKTEITDAVIAFCEALEDAGYFVGIYASDISGYKDKLEHDRITEYAHWVARYGNKPTYCKDYQIWQYSSKGSVDGISGSVDLDYSTTDYSKIMKKKCLNGFKKTNIKKEDK